MKYKKPKGEPEKWITVNGHHIPVYKGQSNMDAIYWNSINGNKPEDTNKKKNKDGEEETKQKQIKANKEQADERNGKFNTAAGKEMNDKIQNYQNKFLKKRSDEEIEEIKNNLEKSGKIAGYSEGDHVALAAIRREQESRKNQSSPKTKESYHVEHVDSVGGKFIDKGKVGDYKIGEKVNYLAGDKMKSGTINKAHIYPNGKIDYNVVDADGDGHNVSSNNLAKTDANKVSKTSKKSKSFPLKKDDKNAEWKIRKAYDRTSLKELALDAGMSSSYINAMSTDDLREKLLAMWKNS